MALPVFANMSTAVRDSPEVLDIRLQLANIMDKLQVLAKLVEVRPPNGTVTPGGEEEEGEHGGGNPPPPLFAGAGERPAGFEKNKLESAGIGASAGSAASQLPGGDIEMAEEVNLDFAILKQHLG